MLLLNTLHIWIAAYHSLIVSTSAFFFEFKFFSFFLLGFLLYTSCVLGLHPSAPY
jgi:hypothetical protein